MSVEAESGSLNIWVTFSCGYSSRATDRELITESLRRRLAP
jgi:hypothetical protein